MCGILFAEVSRVQSFTLRGKLYFNRGLGGDGICCKIVQTIAKTKNKSVIRWGQTSQWGQNPVKAYHRAAVTCLLLNHSILLIEQVTDLVVVITQTAF